MELVINRIKYECTFNNMKIIVSADSNEFIYSYKWKPFLAKFDNQEELIVWAKKNSINSESTISYEFSKETFSDHLILPLTPNFYWKYTWFLIGKGFLCQDFLVDFNPIGFSLSVYQKIDEYDITWDLFERIDFSLNYSICRKIGEATFNIGSQKPL